VINLCTKKGGCAHNREVVIPRNRYFYPEDLDGIPARFTIDLLRNIARRLDHERLRVEERAEAEEWDLISRAEATVLLEVQALLAGMAGKAAKYPRCNWSVRTRGASSIPPGAPMPPGQGSQPGA
jgi:hypothetical protein